MMDYSNPLTFIPLLLTTFALAYASFKANKKNIGWLIISFVVWLTTFVITIFGNKLFS